MNTQSYKAKISLSNIIALALIAAACAYAAFYYQQLPQLMPVHFDFEGSADNYMDKLYGAFLLPFIALVTFALLKLLPFISPKGYQMADSDKALNTFILIITALLCSLSIILNMYAREPGFALNQSIGGVLSVFMLFMGNYLGKVEKNFFLGIRTPWTLTNDEVWSRTHRLAGILLSAAGLAGIISLALSNAALEVAIGTMVAALLIPAAYSFVLYRRLVE